MSLKNIHVDYRLEVLRALALRLLMSTEVPNLDGPHAKELFEEVGDMTAAEAAEYAAMYEDSQS